MEKTKRRRRLFKKSAASASRVAVSEPATKKEVEEEKITAVEADSSVGEESVVKSEPVTVSAPLDETKSPGQPEAKMETPEKIDTPDDMSSLPPQPSEVMPRDNAQDDLTSEILEKNSGSAKSNMLWIIVCIVLIIVGISGAVYIYMNVIQKQGSNSQGTMAVSPTSMRENSPTPTVTQKPVDKSLYSIRILNGSGVRGEAGKVETMLEDAGFTVISTGNADNYDYKETVIQAAKTNKIDTGFLDTLKQTLAETYAVKDTLETTATQSADVVIIVGSTKTAQ